MSQRSHSHFLGWQEDTWELGSNSSPSLSKLAPKGQGWHWGQQTTSLTCKVDGAENEVLYVEWFKLKVRKMEQGLGPWG